MSTHWRPPAYASLWNWPPASPKSLFPPKSLFHPKPLFHQPPASTKSLFHRPLFHLLLPNFLPLSWEIPLTCRAFPPWLKKNRPSIIFHSPNLAPISTWGLSLFLWHPCSLPVQVAKLRGWVASEEAGKAAKTKFAMVWKNKAGNCHFWRFAAGEQRTALLRRTPSTWYNTRRSAAGDTKKYQQSTYPLRSISFQNPFLIDGHPHTARCAMPDIVVQRLTLGAIRYILPLNWCFGN